MRALLDAVNAGTAVVGVVGLGHAGLPLATALAKVFRVVGVDVDERRVASIRRGPRCSPDVEPSRLSSLLETRQLIVSADHTSLEGVDVVVLALPTPLDVQGRPDPSALFVEATRLSPKRGSLVLNVSTSHAGTTRRLAEVFQGRGWCVGTDLFVACSPERLDPGNERYRLDNTPRLVGGMTEACQAVAAALCRTFADPVIQVSSPEIAEAAKLLENSFRAVNLAFVNEFARGCRNLGIDAREVVAAASTLPHGFMRFDPGPGVGGHCIPVDPAFWTFAVSALGGEAPLLELAQSINAGVPSALGAVVERALAHRGASLAGSAILLGGIAYKANVSDCRNSPAEALTEWLEARGARDDFEDPIVEPGIVWKGRVGVEPDSYERWDSVILVTDHAVFDYARIAAEARLVVDSRGAFRRLGLRSDTILEF